MTKQKLLDFQIDNNNQVATNQKNISKNNKLIDNLSKEMGNLNAVNGMKNFTKDLVHEKEFAKIEKQIETLGLKILELADNMFYRNDNTELIENS